MCQSTRPHFGEYGKEIGIDRRHGIVIDDGAVEVGAQELDHEMRVECNAVRSEYSRKSGGARYCATLKSQPSFGPSRNSPHHSSFMKSAYELAMERLEKQSPTRQLTEAQKTEIAEIETATKARIAEQELFLKGKITEAMEEGKYEEAQQMERQLTQEIRRANEDAEAKKAKVRGGK